MNREVNRVCELSCDEAVIKSLDEGGRRAYGDTLLNAVEIGGNYKNSLATVTLNESTELLKDLYSKRNNASTQQRFFSAAGQI